MTSRGGSRPGAGRKPAGTQCLMIRLTPSQRKTFKRLGGSAWMQRKMDSIMTNAKNLLDNIFEQICGDCESREELLQRSWAALQDGEFLAAEGVDQDTTEEADALLYKIAALPSLEGQLFVFQKCGDREDFYITAKEDFMRDKQLEGTYDDWMAGNGEVADTLDFTTQKDAVDYVNEWFPDDKELKIAVLLGTESIWSLLDL